MTTDGRINVLLIGGGGREHALAWKMTQSPRMGKLWLTDASNPGLAALGTAVDVPVDIKQIFRLQRFCEKNAIGLVVIGPEEPLAQGYTDALIAPNRVVFGPTQQAARLEWDKAYAKQLMRAASIPTAEGRIFTDVENARAYVESRVSDEPALTALYEKASSYRDAQDRRAFIRRAIEQDKSLAAAYRKRHDDLPVIKASGLAKGKGVILPSSLAEAMDAIDRIMVRQEFGEAGKTILIEERLEGREVSVLALTDGRAIYILEACEDHKRLGDGDTGPNTGGMGVICPGALGGPPVPGGSSSESEQELLKQIEQEILVPTVDAMRRDGIDYRGVLYAGLMLTPAGPKVLEFNCRFGDPECQALMIRFESDLIDVLLAVGTRKLEDVEIKWAGRGAMAEVASGSGEVGTEEGAASCVVVMAAEGYPGKPKSGAIISGIEAASKVAGVHVFQSGTKRDGEGHIVTAGGRVLSVAATGATLAEARARAYEACGAITFSGRQMRSDIGAVEHPRQRSGSRANPSATSVAGESGGATPGSIGRGGGIRKKKIAATGAE